MGREREWYPRTVVTLIACWIWAWSGAAHAYRTFREWMLRPKPPLLQVVAPPDDPGAVTERSVRPVMDQRPRIEVFTLPQNTFSF